MPNLLSPTAGDATSCCVSGIEAALDVDQAQRLARVFKALGDPTRVRLMSLISAHSGGEACVCELTEPVGLTQGTVSHHLKQLVEAGLVEREQRGRWSYYRVVEDVLDTLAGALLRS